jgi:dolichyl-phosphate beta-glucosyltransferase
VDREHPSGSPELSIVVPAYNEASRLLPYLRSIVHYLTRRARRFEIIVVDDGSLDDTSTVVQDFARHLSTIRLITLPTCLGKGGAVRQGMLAAQGRWQLFADADGATPISELDRLEQALRSGAEIAIGSRSLASRLPAYTVKSRWHRSVFGGFFNTIVQAGGITGIADTQCGFKLFEKAAAQDLFSVSCVNGYGFDLELLYIAQRRGYRIAEVPVNWTDQPGSKVRLVRDGLGMLRELARIHQNAAKGFYLPASRSHDLSPLSSSSPVLE